MTDVVLRGFLNSLAEQRAAILDWLGSDECVSWCRTCARRAGLGDDMSGDVRSESWVRLSRALDRRVDFFPEMLDLSSAHRYAARTCERTAIDLARSSRWRLTPVSVAGGEVDFPAEVDVVGGLVGDLMLEQWKTALVETGKGDYGCTGCPSEVVVGVALRILDDLVSGDRGSLRDLTYEALADIDERSRDDRSAASRQRKSRCGRCVVSLLRATAQSLGYPT